MVQRSHTDPFKTCKILNISDVYEQQTILFVYDYETNKLPMPFKNLFRHNYEVQPKMHTSFKYLLMYQEINLSKIFQILLFQSCETNGWKY